MRSNRSFLLYVQCESKKQFPVYFAVVSTYADRFLQYLAQHILRKYATHKLLICPPQLHNAAALPWEKLLSSFQYFKHCFLWYKVGGSEKSQIFGAELRMQTWRWTELLQMLEVTTTDGRAGSQSLGEVCNRLVDVFLRQPKSFPH